MADSRTRVMQLTAEERARLAMRLAERRRASAEARRIPRRPDGAVIPLSYAQQRLWFLDQYEPNSPVYNIPAAVRLRGHLDTSALERSLAAIVKRHESLRTRFDWLNGDAVQIVAPQLDLTLPFIDLRDLPPQDREEVAQQHMRTEAQQPFDLRNGPLLRASLLRLDIEEHILLLTLHHIVADGWSMQVLVRELSALYSAMAEYREVSLPDLTIQYGDVSHWQRRVLSREALRDHLTYWRETLDGATATTDLPMTRRRPAAMTHAGCCSTVVLPEKLGHDLRELARRQNVTLFMLLLAVWNTLLYRYTGHKDVSIGTPVANRDRSETEGLIGFFVNTLVIRTDLAGEPTFLELLGRVRERVVAAFAHQEVPFELLVEELAPHRDMSHSPFFQIMFDWQDISAQTLQLPGLEVEILDNASETAKFDLLLAMEDMGDRLKAVFEYNTDLFEANTIRRIQGHYITLLEDIVRAPDKKIAYLTIMPESERQQLLVEWNATATPFPDQITIHRLFEQQAQAAPDVPAVVIDGEISYRELNTRANQLARRLVRLGVGPDHPVGVCIERSIDMITALLAVLKAGGAYLPLDPTYPAQRLAFMLADSGAQVLLTQAHLRELLPTEGVHVLCVDAERAVTKQEDGADLDSAVTPDNLAYVIYTSGSTGQPKGVMIPHRGVLNLLTGLEQEVYQRHPSSGPLRASLNAPLSFDASVQQLVLLLRGHTLYVLPDEIRADGEALLRYIREHRLDVLDCVPTQLKLLLAAGLLDGKSWAPSIILPGGEAIDAMTWRTLAEAPATVFYNMYGPTECTVDATTCRADDHPEGPVIGRPLANRTCYVLDEHRQPVPIGVPGELYIGGEGLARGYLNRSELTAERFVADPFREEPGARMYMYRTGDLVRYLADGQIEFLGRVDHQVKVRGHRIELGEIENLLRGYADVAEATVIVREDAVGDQRLVAYVVCADGQQCQPLALRQHLEAQLPEYMVPGSYVQLEAMPLTPNGKIDRQALPAPEEMERVVTSSYTPPRSPVEELLCELWAQVLGGGQVGIHDDFFELGGHSLLATQLVSRIRKTLSMELPLRELFQYRTIAELGERIAELRDMAGPNRPPIEKRPADGPPPLSYGQQRLWFLDQLEPDSALYNIPLALRLQGKLDKAALMASLQEMVQRHEVLRSVYPTVNGVAQQIIESDARLDLAVSSLCEWPENERQHEVDQTMRLAAQEPFDLAKGPLMRARLIQLAPTEHILVVVLHHMVADGWSAGVLLSELQTIYEAQQRGEASPLEPMPLQYSDYAAWQRQWLEGSVLEQQIEYWRQQLANQPPLLELPTDRPRPAMASHRGALLPFEFGAELTKALQGLCRREGVTLFMALLAGLQMLLHRYTNETDISVGTPVANRTHADTEGLIGFLVNTLVLRTDLGGNPSFREVLERVREVALGAYTHQDVPFEMLVNTLQPQRDPSHSPLFQVMLVLQNAPLGSLRFGELEVEPLVIDSGTAKFDLTLSMSQTDDRLGGTIEYNTDLFDAATIGRMAEHLEYLLQAVVQDPDGHIGTLPLLTKAERERLLVEWNATATPFADETAVHRLFEQQAAANPQAIALRFQGASMTYDELNRRANQLARVLGDAGVVPGTLVGLCLERSFDMIVALLGILKAGGAYLPLDADYPRERLAYMLADSQAPVLVTHSALLERLPVNGIVTVCVDCDAERIAAQDDGNLDLDVGPEDLAYVIYTSGSTGQPKGVLLAHRGVCNLMGVVANVFDISAATRMLQFSSLSFDASVVEILGTLTNGGRLCLARRETLLSPGELVELVKGEGLTILQMPPSLLALLDPEAFETVETVASVGEACPPQLARQWSGRYRFLNGYGPTEATVATSFCTIVHLPADASRVPIGGPIANTQVYVLDGQMQPVPVGVPGELYVSGAGLARGYLNRPELTAERFVPNPFSAGLGARMYKTGDLVRWLDDGILDFLGRIDHQVKIRGFRVELGEIESAIGKIEGIEEQVVIMREDAPGRKRLVAYLVAAEANAPSVSAIRAHLEARLPEYMVPTAFVILPEMPLTPNGKIDRAALPAPDVDSLDLAGEYEAPRSERERILADIWCELLGVERVGVHDSFFELGGDSILSIQAVSRAVEAGMKLTPRQLFQYPTIAQLAAVADLELTVEAEQGMVTGQAPLTPIQVDFFMRNLAEPNHWNQAVLLSVQKPLVPEHLSAAMAHLARHHDALRHRFHRSEDGWVQEVDAESIDVPVRYLDLAQYSSVERSAAIRRIIMETQASLDLAAGPLLRAVYIDTGPQEAGRLLLVAHHLIIDGVSWRVLLEDLQTVLRQLGSDEPISLPRKTTSYRRWAESLMEYAQSDAVKDQLPYWASLAKAPLFPLPGAHREIENTEAQADTVRIMLSHQDTQALLTEVPHVYGTEINDALLATLGQVLTRWIGDEAIFLDLEGHGRENIAPDVDVSRTVGWFTSVYPVRLALNNPDDIGACLKEVKEQLRQIPERGIGYGLLRYLSKDADVCQQMARMPQPQIVFNYLGRFQESGDDLFAPATESVEPSRSPRARRKHLLDISGSIIDSRLATEWAYPTELYKQATIQILAEQYVQALQDIIAHCQSSDAGGYTPSDFQDVDLDEDDLEAILSEISEATHAE